MNCCEFSINFILAESNKQEFDSESRVTVVAVMLQNQGASSSEYALIGHTHSCSTGNSHWMGPALFNSCHLSLRAFLHTENKHSLKIRTFSHTILHLKEEQELVI